jgi:hypothetical protein
VAEYVYSKIEDKNAGFLNQEKLESKLFILTQFRKEIKFHEYNRHSMPIRTKRGEKTF